MTSSLSYYQGLGYGEINSTLRQANDIEQIIRDNPSDDISMHIREIDSIMRNDGSLEETMLYRGYSNGFIPTMLRQSNVITSKSYNSSTSDINVAKKSFTSDDGCCIIMFKIPYNIKYYIYPQTIGKYTEREILIQRNVQFVIDIQNSSHPVYIAELQLWNPPIIHDQENVFEGVKQISKVALKLNYETLVNKYGDDTAKDMFIKNRIKYYMDEDDMDEDEADFLATDDFDDMNM
jgi:hypothetical protein